MGDSTQAPARCSSDSGSNYRSHDFAAALAATGTFHKRTWRYRPQTNGKVERFHRTLATEWAYASEAARRRALPTWLPTYNLTGATPPSAATARLLRRQSRWSVQLGHHRSHRRGHANPHQPLVELMHHCSTRSSLIESRSVPAATALLSTDGKRTVVSAPSSSCSTRSRCRCSRPACWRRCWARSRRAAPNSHNRSLPAGRSACRRQATR